MKRFVIFVVFFNVCFSIFCQNELAIGKRNGSILNREIKKENIGMEGGYLKPIYFKAVESESWQKAGYLCKKLRPYLYANSNAKKEYKIYQKQALISQGLIVPAYISLMGYSLTGLNNIANGKSKTAIGAYFRPNALAWLGAYLGSIYGSMYLGKNSETHLFKAVQLKNERFKTSFSGNGFGINYVFR